MTYCELTKQFRFEAAHFLPHFPPGHKCRRLHGHSFIVEIAVFGPVDPFTGIVIDYGNISLHTKPLVELLDHRLINEVGSEIEAPLLLNPTSENLAIWFYHCLQPYLIGLSAITIFETCTTSCTYRPSQQPTLTNTHYIPHL
jgi:6-pyruvoyltetrahydropterin/6-carboxytetrahydropterin synthase